MSAKQGFPLRPLPPRIAGNRLRLKAVQNPNPNQYFACGLGTQNAPAGVHWGWLWATKTHVDAHAADTLVFSCSYLLMV